ncbi:NO-inducible flavohemoprotein [Peribacillus sp. FSL H8-0477]|uniref:NO-inducible flavohemoprotein n=1 Tax=Peribacillus sp. FSL H8-0477 TaxID=2921388 RepID=UPI0030F5E0D6
MLSQQTINIIKSTVPALEVKGNEITTLFYKTLFENYPELLNIFNQANQKKGRQQTALANTVLAAAKHIDQLETILPVVKQIAQKHRSLAVKPEHYPIVGEYLLKAIKEVLGDAATEEILTAWGDAYGVIAGVFIDIEKDMYKEASSQKGGWLDFKEFVIADRIKESNVITSFYLKPVDGEVLPDFKPGQYITIRLRVPGEEYLVNRQYSLSAASGKESFRISVKRESAANTPEGKASNFLHEYVNVGDTVELTAPAGDFVLDLSQPTKPIVFLSGGVGITPFMSMIQTVAEQQPSRPVTFIHASQNGSAQAFKNELNSYNGVLSNYRLAFAYSNPTDEDLTDRHFGKQGYVDADFLSKFEHDLNADYYLCGPVAFLRSMIATLTSMGVSQDQIHYEFFGPAIQL